MKWPIINLFMKYLLVIIDPQNDFTHSKGNYASRHRIRQISEAKSKINLLVGSGRFQTIVVRADYHADQFDIGVSMAIPGTFGHEIDAEIILPMNTLVITKCDHSCFTSPDFLSFLAKQETDHLLLCGFLAEYCIKQTALDALAAGLQVTLVKDGIGTGDDVQNRREAVFIELEKKGCILLNAADCLNL